MGRTTTVTLASNGDYWQARYYDSQGRRRTKSLGPKKSRSKPNGLTQRAAKVLCDRLAADQQRNPGLANSGKAPKLGEFLQAYLDSRTDLKPRTKMLHDMTARYLEQHFGDNVRIDSITRAMASEWHDALAQGRLDGARTKPESKSKQATQEKTKPERRTSKPPSQATVCGHVRTARVIFGRAMRDDLLIFNPFDRLSGVAPAPDKDWKYVNLKELDQLLAACRNDSWRAFLGLQRLAGLRRGEALTLLWRHVDLDKNQLTVFAEKTGSCRVVPIVTSLRELLVQVKPKEVGEGQAFVLDPSEVSRNSLAQRMDALIKRAGLKPWRAPFQVLRRNRATDWAQEYPQYVVSAWMGHDATVSMRHYLQVPDELYERAAGSPKHQTRHKKPRKTGTKTGTKANKDARAVA